jgi:putative transposase
MRQLFIAYHDKVVDLGDVLLQPTDKTQWSRSTLVWAGRFFPSTKICSVCGAVVDLPRLQRVYSCAACGLVLDRDLSAARNTRPMSVTPTDINADGVVVRPGFAWQIPVKSEPSTTGREMAWRLVSEAPRDVLYQVVKQ